MPDIELPDGKKIAFSKSINGFEIVKKISQSLAKEACIMSVNGELKDLSFSINKSVQVKIITIKDKTGYFFKNKDPNDLANSIVALMQKDYNSLKSLGIEGRKNVLKKFDVDKMCQTTFTEYKKLIKLS